MPRESPAQRAERLNQALAHHGAVDVLSAARQAVDRLALVSSFGAESVVLLHLVSVVDRAMPVLFIDTEMLFAETLVYQQEVSERLGLRNLRIIRAEQAALAAHDPFGRLHLVDPDRCCDLRKTQPLQAALAGFDGWITGRKRFQGGPRQSLAFFEAEPATGRLKVNPLARWAKEDVITYMEENRLPRHPLVAKGYPSIGCMPCTSPAGSDEEARAGRWRGQDKVECGIHLAGGQMRREQKGPDYARDRNR